MRLAGTALGCGVAASDRVGSWGVASNEGEADWYEKETEIAQQQLTTAAVVIH